MALTSIADMRSPSRPIEITFAPEQGLPSANQEVLLIGHAQVGAPASTIYAVKSVSNSADSTAALAEMVSAGYGSSSEITKMVLAAIAANAGQSNFPALKVCALASTDSDFGASDAALTAVQKVKAEFVVSPYVSSNQTLTGKLKTAALSMSGPQRTENSQFGTVGVAFERATVDPSTLFAYDSQYLFLPYMRDTGSPTYSVAEMAAACAARAAGLSVPFNPLDDVTIQNVVKPAAITDILTIGAGLESEAALGKGYTPLKVKANGEVAFVRTITSRLSADGTGNPLVTAYYDLQDFMVLYFWRKTVFTRVSQPDFKQAKASEQAGKLLKSEMIRLAKVFEDQTMFQAVDKLAPSFKVERSLTDRHRFDVLTPINCVPGLHVIATNVRATTQFDSFSI